MVVSSNTHMSLEDQAELVKGYYIEKFDTDECKYVDWIKIVTCMRKISNVSNCYPEEKQLVQLYTIYQFIHIIDQEHSKNGQCNRKCIYYSEATLFIKK